MMRRLSFLLLFFLVFTGCKEKPTRHHKAQPQYDIEKVSLNIAQYTSTEIAPVEPPKTDERQYPILDFSNILQDGKGLDFAPPKLALSKFPSASEPICIRVNLAIKSGYKAKNDDIEERIWSILTEHAPEPWELRKSSTIDSHESCGGRLSVEFKRQTLRLKKASKTAAQRAEIKFSFNMELSVPKGMKASWDGWRFDYQDEVTLANEGSVNTLFWQKLSQTFPTLTVISPDETDQWLKTQGLSPLILNNALNAIRIPNHVYYPSGCLISKNEAQALELRMIRSPYAPAQHLDIPNIIDMACSREAMFAVSAETPLRMALYYQPHNSLSSWKSQIIFSDSIKQGDLSLHVDDDLVCLYSRGESIQNRGVEIHCLDRKTGLIRWQTKRFPGTLRGIAFGEKQVVFANDQGIFVISRQGELELAKRIQTSSRLRKRQFCQLQNRLIFMTGPGQFVSWNIQTGEFDWQAAVLDSDFIHCSQQNTLIFSEVGGYLLAIDVEQNKPIWKFRTVSEVRDAFSYGEMIYLLLDKAILVLDRSTGRRKAQIPLPWQASQFIRIGADLYLDTPDAVYRWR